ncbi:MAG: hypothetical protein KDJ65_18320 [Anaerolineae bacterium]|nr:hypothetical protein [Anaerolineae bacterium]
MGFFDSPFITRIRRNHGFEHATIHILSKRHENLSMVGRSDWNGFTLYGPIDTAEVQYAANEALRRLRGGEANLAVHPRCGTVLATTGLLTALATFTAIGLENGSRARFRWSSIPAAILAATGAAIFAQPLGLFLQEQYTTSGEPGNLEIKSISLNPNARVVTHRVETTQ